MKINLTFNDINYLLRLIAYNAVDNSPEGAQEDKRLYNKLKKQLEALGYRVDEF